MGPRRVLLHVSRTEQRVVDPDEVYCLVLPVARDRLAELRRVLRDAAY